MKPPVITLNRAVCIARLCVKCKRTTVGGFLPAYNLWRLKKNTKSLLDRVWWGPCIPLTCQHTYFCLADTLLLPCSLHGMNARSIQLYHSQSKGDLNVLGNKSRVRFKRSPKPLSSMQLEGGGAHLLSVDVSKSSKAVWTEKSVPEVHRVLSPKRQAEAFH